MKIKILDDDLTKRVYDVAKLENIDDAVVIVDSSHKENSALQIIKAYKSGKKLILFDDKNQKIKELLDQINFHDVDFAMLLFSSGTSGNPVGAFKTKKNLEEDVQDLVKILQSYSVKKVISTVPFVHIYGILTSILLPYILGIDLFFKKHFLPHDLLESIEPHSAVVTTPLYIKSLLRLKETKDLSDVVFLSSTAPLENDIAQEFIEKFNTNLIQLFGSTETGSIAYKKQLDTLWKPFDRVEVSTNENNLLKIKSPFISELVYEKGFKHTQGVIQSFDYVEFSQERFKIIGRSSQIFKVGGKRFSTLHVEEILESMPNIDKSYVTIKYEKEALKDEILLIFVESLQGVNLKEINSVLKQKIGNIKFPIRLKVVDKIPTTAMGKKIIPL